MIIIVAVIKVIHICTLGIIVELESVVVDA